MKYVVTGCAGFIGSNYIDNIINNDEIEEIHGIDNLSTGNFLFMQNFIDSPKFFFHNTNLLFKEELNQIFKDTDVVVHFAANADVKGGVENPHIDLEQNTIVTHNVLEQMRKNKIKKIIFSSTGSIYGEHKQVPTPEDAKFPIQTSMYGASKLACEGLITAYCFAYDIKSWIFRFVSIIGEKYTHGHIIDFYNQLKKDPNNLYILGDGTQTKSYLYVLDCISGIEIAFNKFQDKVNIINLGVDNVITVNESAKIISDYMKLNPKITYSGGKQGWIGDNPYIHLCTKKIQSIGWKPKMTINNGIINTLEYFKRNNI